MVWGTHYFEIQCPIGTCNYKSGVEANGDDDSAIFLTECAENLYGPWIQHLYGKKDDAIHDVTEKDIFLARARPLELMGCAAERKSASSTASSGTL